MIYVRCIQTEGSQTIKTFQPFLPYIKIHHDFSVTLYTENTDRLGDKAPEKYQDLLQKEKT